MPFSPHNLAFTGCFVIAIAILAMDSAQDFFDGVFDIHPELLRVSSSRHHANTQLAVSLAASKSPLFQAMKARYKEVVGGDQDVAKVIEKVVDFEDELKERYMAENLRGNKTTHVMQRVFPDGDLLWLVGINNEVESASGMFNPHFSKVTLYQVDYLKYLESGGTWRKHHRNGNDIKVCQEFIVPGLITLS
jgi:hypothetical protein